MGSEEFKVRKLTKEDVTQYKKIRLESLKDTPEAFGSSVEEEENQEDGFFVNRIENNIVVGCFDKDLLIGIAGLTQKKGIKRCHRGVLWGCYASPKYRKLGVGQLMVRGLFKNTPNTIEQIILDVGYDNKPARETYQKSGFEEYGVEKKAMKVNGQYYDEIMMIKFLK